MLPRIGVARARFGNSNPIVALTLTTWAGEFLSRFDLAGDGEMSPALIRRCVDIISAGGGTGADGTPLRFCEV